MITSLSSLVARTLVVNLQRDPPETARESEAPAVAFAGAIT